MENRSIKIVFVGNDPDKLISLSALIKEAFPLADVFGTENTEKCINLISSEEMDLIFFDNAILQSEGYNFCKKLKKNKILCDIPFVFIISTKEDQENLSTALKCGADAFIKEPIEKIDIIAQVSSMIKIKTANIEKKKVLLLLHEETIKLEKAQREIKKIHEALKIEKEKRKKNIRELLKVQKIAKIGSFEHDISNNKLALTEEALKIFGLNNNSYLKKIENVTKLIHPDDIEAVIMKVKRSIGEKCPMEDVFRIIKPDGEEIFISLKFIPIFDENGKHIENIGTVEDITDIKRSEKNLQEEKIFENAVFNSIPGYLYVYDEDGRLLKWNKNHEVMTGYTAEELSGMTLSKWYDGEDAVRVAEAAAEVFRTGYGEVEADLITKDGKKLRVHSNGVRFSFGGKRYFTGVGSDLTEQKKIEAELKEAKEYFELVFNTSPDAALVTRLSDEVIMNVNDGFIQISGFSKEESLGKSSLELNLYADISDRQKIFEIMKEKSFCRDIEVNYRHKDGTIIAGLISAKRVFIKGVGYMFTNMHDITKRKLMEESIKESEKKYRQITENISDIIWTADLDLKMTYISPSVEKLLGEPPDVHMKRGTEEKFTIASLNKIRTLWAEELEKEKNPQSDKSRTRIIEAEHYKADGTTIWVSMHISFLRDENGNAVGVQGVSRDITARMNAELALQESENLYRTFIDASSDMIFLKDEQFKHLIVNKSMADFFSKNKENVFGKSDFELMQRPFAEKCRETDIEALSGTTDSVHIFEEATDNCVYETSKFPVILQNGKIGVGGFIRNITERKKIEENLLYISYHDQLTGLHNRRYIEEQLIRLDKEENLPISIIMCDVNGLKLINDSFGTLLGDEILKATAEVLKKGCREGDIIARLGGDEFVIILPKTDILQTEQMVNRFNLSASKVMIKPVALSISYGYETKDRSDQRIQDILSQAENNLYRHKISESASMRNTKIGLIMNMLFEKSNREERHSKRVGDICEVIATKMQFSKINISQIKTAGLIHDIGKIGIDEKTLNKSQALDPDEWKEIKKHPEAGWRILNTSNEFSELAGFVLEHHERWDGKGYPRGLKEEEISVQARIIAVADSYDAMTNERSYRQALSEEDAIIELQKSSGTQFDPQVVNAFMEIIRELNSIAE